MKNILVRALGAFALGAAIGSAQAATVTLTDWAYGAADAVQVSVGASLYNSLAGAMSGTLAGVAFFNEKQSFVTYALELEERFNFGEQPVQGYRLVDGARYFQQWRGNAEIAERLGRLMTYAAQHPALVETAAGSTALQLAIWNIVYDGNFEVMLTGRFNNAGSHDSAAAALLAGAQAVGASGFDVFALQRYGSQDLLLLVARTGAAVPEPGSLALAALALLGAGALRRRVSATA